mmetsp:Transcript_36000/g.47368  ORF Transcript_36000/g.47368 Transcript_36000/m.47368 type:complete len:82 (+) Transcript_36000:1066-1311(+)
MIPYFKKYQLAEVEGDQNKLVFDAALLGSRARALIAGDDEESRDQRRQELDLMETMRDISFTDNAADYALLFEVTGYHGVC